MARGGGGKHWVGGIDGDDGVRFSILVLDPTTCAHDMVCQPLVTPSCYRLGRHHERPLWQIARRSGALEMVD